MLAFVNTAVTKPQIMRQLKAHAKADEFAKGYYWGNGKGCAVGCTVHSNNHALYETNFGIPQMLAWLENCIFEGLPNGTAKAWPVRFMAAVKPKSDLSRVGWQFLYWLLTDKSINPGIDHPLVKDAIRQCADVLIPLTKGQPVDITAADSAAYSAVYSVHSARLAAASAAYSAAHSADSARLAAYSARLAADSAAYSADSAAYSADSAADSARLAADSAARLAADSAYSADSARLAADSAYSARLAAYIKMADKLIELMEAA